MTHPMTTRTLVLLFATLATACDSSDSTSGETQLTSTSGAPSESLGGPTGSPSVVSPIPVAADTSAIATTSPGSGSNVTGAGSPTSEVSVGHPAAGGSSPLGDDTGGGGATGTAPSGAGGGVNPAPSAAAAGGQGESSEPAEDDGGTLPAESTDTPTTEPPVTGSNLPPLVVSGPDNYWDTSGTLTTGSGASTDLVVDPSTRYQRWDGFGGTFNEMGWDALSVVSSEIPRAMTLLFDADEGANFVYGRLPLGASDYSMSWYTLAETANDYEMENFSIDRDRQMLIPFIKEALKVKPDLHLWASPWVVPDWMMNGRDMKSDAQTLEAHALYMAKFVEEYATEGVNIEAIHPQNEPGYARVHWTAALLIDFIKSYLGPKFEERDVPAEIWCGTMSHPDDGAIATTLANDPEAMKYTTGFGLQWNLADTVAELAPFGPVMQTEHRCGNYNFAGPYWDQSRYDANKAQNDHLYGEESWQLIRDWIVAGVNSYSAWNMVLDTVGKSLDNWPQNALLVVDRNSKQLIETPAYYVFRHYSQYIAPGATRIEISGSADALAFANPDGAIIVEVYAATDSPRATSVQLGDATYQFEVPAHGWATLRIAP